MYYDYSPQFLIHIYPHMRSAEEAVLYSLMKFSLPLLLTPTYEVGLEVVKQACLDAMRILHLHTFLQN
jgi:hypothetical protein